MKSLFKEDRVITLKWGHLKDEEFMRCIGEFYNKKLGLLYAKNMAILYKKIKEEMVLSQEVHNKLLTEYGTPDPDKAGNYLIADDKKPGFAVEWEKFLKTEFVVNVPKFDLKKLSELLMFSPQDLMVLEDVFVQDEIEVKSQDADTVKSDSSEQTPTTH
jgi:hypothetical protein